MHDRKKKKIIKFMNTIDRNKLRTSAEHRCNRESKGFETYIPMCREVLSLREEAGHGQ